MKHLVLVSLLAAGAVAACDPGADSGDDAATDTDVDSDIDTDETFEGDLEHAGGYYDGDAGIVIEAYEGYEGQGCGWSAVAGLKLRGAAAGDYALETQSQLQNCDKCLLLGASCSIPNAFSCGTEFIATTT